MLKSKPLGLLLLVGLEGGGPLFLVTPEVRGPFLLVTLELHGSTVASRFRATKGYFY